MILLRLMLFILFLRYICLIFLLYIVFVLFNCLIKFNNRARINFIHIDKFCIKYINTKVIFLSYPHTHFTLLCNIIDFIMNITYDSKGKLSFLLRLNFEM